MISLIWSPRGPEVEMYTTTGTAPRKPSDLLLTIYCADGKIKEEYVTVKENAIEEIKWQPFY